MSQQTPLDDDASSSSSTLLVLRLQEDVESYKNLADGLEDEVDSLIETNKELRQAMQSLQQEIKDNHLDTQTQCTQYENSIGTLEAVKSKYQKQVVDLQVGMDEAEQRERQTAASLADLQETYDRLRESSALHDSEAAEAKKVREENARLQLCIGELVRSNSSFPASRNSTFESTSISSTTLLSEARMPIDVPASSAHLPNRVYVTDGRIPWFPDDKSAENKRARLAPFKDLKNKLQLIAKPKKSVKHAHFYPPVSPLGPLSAVQNMLRHRHTPYRPASASQVRMSLHTSETKGNHGIYSNETSGASSSSSFDLPLSRSFSFGGTADISMDTCEDLD